MGIKRLKSKDFVTPDTSYKTYLARKPQHIDKLDLSETIFERFPSTRNFPEIHPGLDSFRDKPDPCSHSKSKEPPTSQNYLEDQKAKAIAKEIEQRIENRAAFESFMDELQNGKALETQRENVKFNIARQTASAIKRSRVYQELHARAHLQKTIRFQTPIQLSAHEQSTAPNHISFKPEHVISGQLQAINAYKYSLPTLDISSTPQAPQNPGTPINQVAKTSIAKKT